MTEMQQGGFLTDSYAKICHFLTFLLFNVLQLLIWFFLLNLFFFQTITKEFLFRNTNWMMEILRCPCYSYYIFWCLRERRLIYKSFGEQGRVNRVGLLCKVTYTQYSSFEQSTHQILIFIFSFYCKSYHLYALVQCYIDCSLVYLVLQNKV